MAFTQINSERNVEITDNNKTF